MRKMNFSDQKVYKIDENTTSYNFPKPLCSDQIGRGKTAYDLLELFCGFDVETTTITQEDGKHLSFVYHFQFSIGTPRILNVYLFRTWDTFLTFIDAMADFYQLNEKRHMVCAIFNFSYEFSFLAYRLNWDRGEWDFFAKDKYQPLRATYRGIEFREVQTITGGNLAQLAKDYCFTQKMVGDLDFKKLRNSKTELNPVELQYTINDVVILSEFMWFLFNEYIRPDKNIPMTFTGILKREIKDELKRLCFQRDDKLGLKHGSSFDEWMAYINSMQPDQEHYQLYFKWFFRGGYVHGNSLFTDQLLKMRGKDFTSMYPAHMSFIGYMPVTPFKPVQHDPNKMWKLEEKDLNSKCLIIHCIVDYIRPLTTHTIESKNKIPFYTNAKWDNGRLISCDQAEFWWTEQDYKIFRMYYSFAGITLLEVLEAKRGRYPKYLTNVISHYYKLKEQLKSSGQKDTPAYNIAKSRVNSLYGLTVQRVHLQKVLFNTDKGWFDDPVVVDYEKEIKKSILPIFAGIWCTSNSRYSILSLMKKLTDAGVSCFYVDTDSIKYAPCHKAEQIIKHMNTTMYRHRMKRKLRSDYYTGFGELDEDYKHEDGTPAVVDFKMLGAKRYITALDGHVKATVAGMPKSSIDCLGETPEEILNSFSRVGYHLTPSESGKLTTDYTEYPYSAEIDGEMMHELSGVALYEIPFSLNLKKEYVEHLDEIQAKFNREEGLL